MNLSEDKIVKTLEQLKKDELITYSAQHNDIEIVFLVPREDDRTINTFAKKVELLIEQKTKNIDAVINVMYVPKQIQLKLKFLSLLKKLF